MYRLLNALLYLDTGNVGRMRITFHFARIENQIQRDFRVKGPFGHKKKQQLKTAQT